MTPFETLWPKKLFSGMTVALVVFLLIAYFLWVTGIDKTFLALPESLLVVLWVACGLFVAMGVCPEYENTWLRHGFFAGMLSPVAAITCIALALR